MAPAVDVTAMLVPGAVVTVLLSAAVEGTRVEPVPAAGMLLLVAGAAAVAATRRTSLPVMRP